MPNVVMLGVDMLNGIMLGVVAPNKLQLNLQFKEWKNIFKKIQI
jgi:hypothetical protein